MGNFNSMISSSHGKVILFDGSVHEFKDPLTVAELMMDHPRQFVVEIQAATVAGKRPTPLPADMKLDMNKVYLMLPMRGGKPVSLSTEELRRVFLHVNSGLVSKSLLSNSLKIFPWFVKICPTTIGGGDGMFPVRIKEEADVAVVSESMEVRPEYLSRELSGKGWKPSLDTIKEKKIERKFSHWLFK